MEYEGPVSTMNQTAAPGNRSLAPLIIGGTLCTLAYVWLAAQSNGYGTATLGDLLLTAGFCSLISAALWIGHQRGTVRLSIGGIIGFAVLFRLVGLWAFPILEDDFYRYLWDGFMSIEYGSPYLGAPAAFFDSTLPDADMENLLGQINYPEVATVYGPTAQWAFALSYLVAPGSITALQVIVVLADLATLAVLSRLAPLAGLFLYAFSPLLIKELAMTAHIDALGAMCVTLALLAFSKRWWLSVGVLLALACGVKVFALVIAPFLLGLSARAWLAFALTGFAIALPFGLTDAWLPEGLGVMSNLWLFNSPIHIALAATQIIDPVWRSTLPIAAYAGLWGACFGRWIWQWWQATDSDPRRTLSDLPLHWLFGLFLLALPVINPWYLVWWLPFAALRPRFTPWIASAAVLLSYASGINLSGTLLSGTLLSGTLLSGTLLSGTGTPSLQLYEIPTWVLGIEYGLIGVAVIADWVIYKRAKNPPSSIDSAY